MSVLGLLFIYYLLIIYLLFIYYLSIIYLLLNLCQGLKVNQNDIGLGYEWNSIMKCI